MTTNPPKPITAAKVRSVLRKAGCDLGVIGIYSPTRDGIRMPVVYHGSYPSDSDTQAKRTRERGRAECHATLTAAGIPCEVVGDEVVVKVEPTGEGV